MKVIFQRVQEASVVIEQWVGADAAASQALRTEGYAELLGRVVTRSSEAWARLQLW